MSGDGLFIGIVIAVVLAICVALNAGVGALVRDEDAAIHAAQNAGLKDVRVTGSHIILVPFSGCSNSDEASVDIQGINANGNQVTATVCQGILKKSTVRY